MTENNKIRNLLFYRWIVVYNISITVIWTIFAIFGIIYGRIETGSNFSTLIVLPIWLIGIIFVFIIDSKYNYLYITHVKKVENINKAKKEENIKIISEHDSKMLNK